MSMIMSDLETSRHLVGEQSPSGSTPTDLASTVRNAPSMDVVKFGDISAKNISLNGNAGRSISLSKASGIVNVNLAARITGRCGDGCPSCIKAVKLALFNPAGERIQDQCYMEHSGSFCDYEEFNDNYSIDTNVVGEWQVRVEGRWALCSDLLDDYGMIVSINVEDIPSPLFTCSGDWCTAEDKYFIFPKGVIIGKRNTACNYGQGVLSVDNYNDSEESGGNCAAGDGSIVSGAANSAIGTGSVVTGGSFNGANGDLSVITGGTGNRAEAQYTVLSGGQQNIADGYTSSIVGGYLNRADNEYTTVVGGKGNSATGKISSAVGGYENHAEGDYSFVTGHYNIASGLYSSVAGGFENNASGKNSFIAGGNGNNATSLLSSIIGGSTNIIGNKGSYGSITGGRGNKVLRPYGSVSGGKINSARGSYSSILGGENVVVKKKFGTFPV